MSPPPDSPPRRVLVAGIGNELLGDDGFGVQVARRLAARSLPEGVAVRAFGIRGLDLALALLDAWDAAILLDATARGGAPGTLYLLEPDPPPPGAGPLDAHGLTPELVLQNRAALGGGPLSVRVIGCEPARLPGEDDPCLELSPPVAAAIEPAVELTLATARALLGATLHA